MMCRIPFLNICVDNLSMEEALERSCLMAENEKPSYIVTPNIDHLVMVETNDELKEAYAKADLILTDGMPLVWISKFLGNPIKQKVSGSDFLPELCRVSARKGYSMFFLGAAPGVAELAADKLRLKYENIQIVGCYSPPLGFEKDPREMYKIETLIRKAHPRILVVALGCPKQEILIYRNKSRWNVPLCLGVGASLDFIAGTVKRAPRWMSNCGLEWFYRLIKEPRRMFSRYFLNDWRIIKIVFKYKK